MSLRKTIGAILFAIAGLYLVIVPIVRANAPRGYVPFFIVIGLCGAMLITIGWGDKPAKSP